MFLHFIDSTLIQKYSLSFFSSWRTQHSPVYQSFRFYSSECGLCGWPAGYSTCD